MSGSQDNSVSVATRYGLDGPGIESRWGRIFRTRPDRTRGHPTSYTNGTSCLSPIKSGWTWR